MNRAARRIAKAFRRPSADGVAADRRSGFVGDIKKNVATAIVGAIVGMSGLIGFWLSPLKDVVMHKLWNESVQLTVHASQRTLRVGDQVEVFVEIVPTAPIAVSEGVLYVSSSDNSLIRKSGLTESVTPLIAAPIILPKSERPVLQATARGRFTISARLKTKFREYAAQTSVDVNAINEPTRQNLSGEWHTRMGRTLGKMELIHRNAEVSGIYALARPEIRGNIGGFVDGSTFNADLVSQGETRRKWLVRATYSQTDGFVEIKGDMTHQVLQNNNWTQVGEKEEFYATSVPRQ